MAEKLSDNIVADTKSSSVRWRYIPLALVLAVIAFLIVPAESLNSTGDMVAGLSYTGRAVVAVASRATVSSRAATQALLAIRTRLPRFTVRSSPF